MTVAAPSSDALASYGAWVLRGIRGKGGGRDWDWVHLFCLPFLLLSGGIVPGVHRILAVAAPGSDFLTSCVA